MTGLSNSFTKYRTNEYCTNLASNVNVLFQVNKGVTLVDLLSFSTTLEAQADQLVS